MKWMHILAGLAALVAGMIALYSAKGESLHRKSGAIFAAAMMFLAGSGALMAIILSPNRVNVIAGTLTLYLVATGLLAVIRTVERQQRALTALSLMAAAATMSAWVLGFMAANSPSGAVDHIPAAGIFMFAVVGSLGLVGDARVLWAGRVEGSKRLTRHLWRMTYALWIATSSFFFGQGKFLPHWIRDSHLNAAPILLVAVTLIYWLVRIHLLKRKPGAAARAEAALGSRA